MTNHAEEAAGWLESVLLHPLTDDQVIAIAHVNALLAIAQATKQDSGE